MSTKAPVKSQKGSSVKPWAGSVTAQSVGRAGNASNGKLSSVTGNKVPVARSEINSKKKARVEESEEEEEEEDIEEDEDVDSDTDEDVEEDEEEEEASEDEDEDAEEDNRDDDEEDQDENETEKKDVQSSAKPTPSSSSTEAKSSNPNEINVVLGEDGSTETRERTFKELGLCKVLCDQVAALGWKSPSIIQQQTLPVAFQNRDIIGLAETGSGKTGAFALPILQALLVKPQSHFALVLAPTRELAVQIGQQFQALGSTIHLRSVIIVGGVDEMDQARALASNPHVIVATPGRIVHHIENTKGFSLRNLRYFVLDEADRLLNMDFEKEINRILEVIPRDRRTFLFSATMTSKVNKLQRASLVDPVKIEVSKKYQTAKNLVQQYVFCPGKFKDVYLTYILNELSGNTAIIFTATCEHTQRVAEMLRVLDFSAIPLHGKLSQEKRLGALNRFKAGQRNILIATDVASRGLDIPAVDLVINYDVPTHSKDYIHRVGRTARAGRSGRAITIVTQYEVELYQRIEALLGYKLKEFEVDKKAALVLLEPVSEAQRLATLALREQEENEQAKKRKRGGGRGGDSEHGPNKGGGKGNGGKKGGKW